MNGTIYIPKVLQNSFTATGRYMPLLRKIEKELGFKILFTDQIDRLDGGTAVTFKAPVKMAGPAVLSEAAGSADSRGLGDPGCPG